MRSLWFKKEYIGPILSGEKVDTVRMKPIKGLQVGELVGAHVGPRPRFATLKITSIDEWPVREMDLARIEAIENIYGVTLALDETLVHISFVLVDE